MFCKIKISKYFVTFFTDSNVTMIFNTGWILALALAINYCVRCYLVVVETFRKKAAERLRLIKGSPD